MKRLYFVGITLLALASIVLMFLDLGSVIDMTAAPYKQIDAVILLIFTADYAVRFYLSKERRKFFKENLFDLIAIIPFNSIFSAFRVFRIFRMAKLTRLTKLVKLSRFVRLAAFLGILKRKTSDILHTNGLLYVIYANIVLILVSSVIMVLAEGMAIGDALWWSVVTVTTVGYGDCFPSTLIGRAVAVVLMIFGIGLIGMLTGAITTYFTSRKPEKVDETTEEITTLIESMDAVQRQKLAEIARIMLK